MAGYLKRAALLLGLMLGPALPTLADQRERIESFAVELQVEANGDLLVTERIGVWATGEAIQRGIFRDFPVRSINALLLNQKVGFELLDVRRDGLPEAHFSERVNAVQRIYVGDSNVLLEPGRYLYELRYRTTRQLLQRDGEDELYWNVTGNNWQFPIEQASIRVTLPKGAVAHAVEGYTGWRGEQGKDYRLVEQQGAQLQLATTRELQPGEGFTVAIAWPAGLVPQPDRLTRFSWLLGDNPGTAIGLVVLIGVLLFYLWHWRRVGRDPRKGVIIPLFEAPSGLSPAALGYVWNRGWRNGYDEVRALTVALTSLAIKGAILMQDAKSGSGFILRLGAGGQPLSRGEQLALQTLFKNGKKPELSVGGSYQPRLATAVSALRATLEKEQRDACFKFNRGIWWWGVAVIVLGIVVTQIAGLEGSDEIGFVIFTLVFTFAFGVPGLITLILAVRGLFSRDAASDTRFYAIFGVIFGSVGLASLAAMHTVVAPFNLGLVLAMVAVCVAFRSWLEAPTLRGRALLDHIEGYRDYLALAESDTLARAGKAPAMSIALYEQHLPYAMALGVEQQWSERLDHALASGLIDTRQAYRPDWYSNARTFSSPQGLSERLTSGLSTATASSASAPASASSSGGSSGGGSSGGGGGGGGGGGW
ncbi:DUF2207 domain-containing protein [Pseudomonas borbori]